MCFALSNFVKQATPPTASYSLSLHDALPISEASYAYSGRSLGDTAIVGRLFDRLQNRFTLNALAIVLDRPYDRSEEHTSELQSRFDLVCRLLLEKKKKLRLRDGGVAPTTGRG